MKHFGAIFLFLVLFFPQLILAEALPLPIVAVHELDGGSLDSSLVRVVTDRLRSEIIKTAQFRVLERGQMDAILSEQAFQQTGCVAEECVVQMGQLLGADYIISGSMGLVGQTYSFAVKLLSVQNGEILRSADQTIEGNTSSILDGAIPTLAIKLVKAFRSESKSSATSLGRGDLFLESEPSGAQIWIDDELQNGTTPLMVSSVEPGVHQIRMRAGDLGVTLGVNLEPSGLVKVNQDLLPLSAAIRINTEPAGAQIWIDGIHLDQQTPALINVVGMGVHRIRCAKIGYADGVDSVYVQFGQVAELQAKLQPAGLVNLSSRRFPLDVLIDDNQKVTLLHDSTVSLLSGKHVLTAQAHRSEEDVFETVRFPLEITTGQMIDFEYIGRVDSAFAEQRFQRKLSYVRWGCLAVSVAGLIGSVMNQWAVDRNYKRYNQAKTPSAFDDAWDDTQSSVKLRNFAAMVGIMGFVGFGVTYAF